MGATEALRGARARDPLTQSADGRANTTIHAAFSTPASRCLLPFEIACQDGYALGNRCGEDIDAPTVMGLNSSRTDQPAVAGAAARRSADLRFKRSTTVKP